MRGSAPPLPVLSPERVDDFVEIGGWARSDNLDRPLCPVVNAAVNLLTSERLDRLKTCPGRRWLFVDESKNRSRRWCTMEECGTHEKMRRYVARRAATKHSR